VADDIRAFMQCERLAPGDRLGREEDLARQFGVSRPTLREALRLLSSAHLIRASKGPGGGIFVAATPEEGIALSVSEGVASMLAADAIDLDELLETRMLVEIPLAGLAAQRATPDEVARIRTLVEESETAGADGDHLRELELDGELHRAIMLAADAIDLDELLETRMLVEIPLAGLAAQRATPDEVARIRTLVEESETAGADGDHLRELELDGELHRAIMLAAGNRLAGAFMAWVMDVLQPSLQERLQPAVVEKALQEQHRDILRGIERGDPTAAERATREHLLYLRDLLSVIEELG
jgi:DNA-binding FadR family transcriptional regulator